MTLRFFRVERSLHLRSLLTREALFPTFRVHLVATRVGVFEEGSVRRLQRCVLRGDGNILVTSARFQVCVKFTKAERLEGGDWRFFQISQRFCLKGGNSVALPDVFRGLPYVVLHVVSSIYTQDIFYAMLATPLPPYFPIEVEAVDYLLHRFQVTFGFRAPTDAVYRVPVGNIRLVTYRNVRLFLCGFFNSRVAKCILIRASMDGAEDVFSVGR